MADSYIVMDSKKVRMAARKCLARIYKARKAYLRQDAEKRLTWPFGLRKLPSEKEIKEKMRSLWLDHSNLHAFHFLGWGREGSCLCLIKASKLAHKINVSASDAAMLFPFMENSIMEE